MIPLLLALALPWLNRVAFEGRVVDAADGSPIAGATVVVRRSVPGGRSLDEALTTGPDGRFSVAFTPEDVAEPRLRTAVVRVDRPGYVARAGEDVAVASLRRDRRLGIEPYFARIPLARGVATTFRFVEPDGHPAAGVPVRFLDRTESVESPLMSDVESGRTDADGRFVAWVTDVASLFLTVEPDRFATLRLGGREADRVDPGPIRLKPGATLTGRLLDRAGRPVPGRTLGASEFGGRMRRSTPTDPDGRFTIAHLSRAEATLFGDGQWGPDLGGETPARAAPIRPVPIPVPATGEPEPIEVRELEDAPIDVRFVDPEGRPVADGILEITTSGPGGIARGRSDSDGRVSLRIIRDAGWVHLFPRVDDDLILTTIRVGNDPPQAVRSTWVDRSVSDASRVEITCHRAAKLVIAPLMDDGGPAPDDLKVVASDPTNRKVSTIFARLADGRFQGRLLPGRAYRIAIRSESAVASRPMPVRLGPGEAVGRLLPIRPRPPIPRVGDLAPPLPARGLDGRPVSLADYRGLYVLVHLWSSDPQHPAPISSHLDELKAIRARHGRDGRLALVGLVMGGDPAEAARVVEAERVDWPQAFFPDGRDDPAIVDLGGGPRLDPVPLLIGPDGRIVARAAGPGPGEFDYGPIREALDEALPWPE